MTLEAIRYHNGTLEILDQLLLPSETKYIPILGVEDGWKAINKMQVRHNILLRRFSKNSYASTRFLTKIVTKMDVVFRKSSKYYVRRLDNLFDCTLCRSVALQL